MSSPAALLVALVALTIAACSAGQTTQPTVIDKVTMPPVTAVPAVTPKPEPPTEPPTPAPTHKPTAPQTPTTRSTPGPDRIGMLGSVLVDALRVRSKPGISDDSIMYEPLLKQGTRFGYIDGPVAASGYQWYLVDLGADSPLRDGVTQGWVAAGDRDGTPWIDAAID